MGHGGGREMKTKIWLKIPTGRPHLGGLSEDGRIILKRILGGIGGEDMKWTEETHNRVQWSVL